MASLGFAFQMVLSAACISPNAPDAVAIRVTMPISVASVPDDVSAALATAVSSSCAVSLPIRPLNCVVIAPWAAS